MGDLALENRDGVWYFKKRVPQDIIDTFGKKYIRKSLKTKDKSEAKKKRNHLLVHYDAIFDDHRAQLKSLPQPEPLTELQALALVHKYIEDRHQDWRTDFENNKPKDNKILEELQHNNDYDEAMLFDIEDPRADQSVALTSNRLLRDSEKTITDEGISIPSLASLVRRGLIELYKRHSTTLSLNHSATHFDDMFDPKTLKQSTVTFGELCEAYRLDYDKTSNATTERPFKILKSEIKIIQQLINPDKLVSTIDYEACIEFRDLMNRIPIHKTKTYGDIPMLEAITMAEEQDRFTMEYETQLAYFSTFKNIIKLGVKKTLLLTDPSADLLPLAEKVPASERRKSFSAEQLVQMFNAPIYRGCVDDEYNACVKGPHIFKRARYWGALILLLNGIRPNEFCSMLTSDIQKTDKGTYYFNIEDNHPSKKLKTATSRRKPPIHPELIKIGFLDYVDGLKAKGEERLFPELKPKNGYYSVALCDWYSDIFLKNTIVKEKRQSFYSLRHNFRNELRRILAPDPVCSPSKPIGPKYSID